MTVYVWSSSLGATRATLKKPLLEIFGDLACQTTSTREQPTGDYWWQENYPREIGFKLGPKKPVSSALSQLWHLSFQLMTDGLFLLVYMYCMLRFVVLADRKAKSSTAWHQCSATPHMNVSFPRTSPPPGTPITDQTNRPNVCIERGLAALFYCCTN